MEVPFYRDTWAEINLDAIEANVVNMRQLLPVDTMVMAVVKANGYGHGAEEVAETALEAGAKWLGVALLDEAVRLRVSGIEAPILVLGWTRPEDVHIAAKYNISITVFQQEWVREASKCYKSQHPVFFHLKFDTGMGRLGVRDYSEAKGLIGEMKSDPRFIIEGAFTHFATADEDNQTYFNEQYSRFKEGLSWLKELGINPNLIHCGNSAASLKHPENMFNLVRFGIAMYGLSPSEEMKPGLPFKLEEAFSFHSRLVHVKSVPPNEGISYGAIYRTEKDEWIGTVPVGYADGWTRSLAKDSTVIVRNNRCPIAGKICMDQFMCRLPYEVPVGEKVTLIGGGPDVKITVDEVAARLGTINYEIPCMISERVPRIYFRSGERLKVRNPLLETNEEI
ncbi:alanine racemase [Scopulibacillus darangshiensis]|uniref:Alanine racemase n=1 Tax=Scopulibacillus darangshiensis TaxID=442528 RepID=A0A4R2NPS2_9BACL|nr:alanine racemase [Scopulibacillus darangshiensis]TCP23823.1 alanine racemase [Scopulibacillus darangshiensis]